MYAFLLALHSLVRWLVVIAMVVSLFTTWRGWLQSRTFTPQNKLIRTLTTAVSHVQGMIGIALYFISPVVLYFLQNFGNAVKLREIRFFGLEHSSMMLTGIILLTIGAYKSKRRSTDKERFKTLAIWYTIAFVIMFFSIPWAFSPLTSRPYLRPF
ncbi:hypothetical protein CLV59_104152 [Chitinophaga dinghuensis]|uniref:Cytochrome B n=1 Tax=Chitinophaga dinghuensis TaxID=1539050 RepID=A0A327VY57_9BACT|nr:hypothetical protein [Chitinophaga dinghuensis]RAJ81927.1 hypothetical protein CLV59_104152 [Chitinophaga dinghuensis]